MEKNLPHWNCNKIQAILRRIKTLESTAERRVAQEGEIEGCKLQPGPEDHKLEPLGREEEKVRWVATVILKLSPPTYKPNTLILFSYSLLLLIEQPK